MVWKPFEPESQLVISERIVIGDIPCLRYTPKGSIGLLPTVIYYHGWHSSKEYQRFKGTVLAVYGYQVIIPDAIYHGERNPINYDEPGAFEKYFWDVVFQNTEESQFLIENIVDKYEADSNRIAVMGNSMGGFSASGVFVKNSNLKCMVNTNGSCAWVKVEEIFREADNMPPISEERIRKLSTYDPMYNKEKLKNRPILMLHGDRDSSVPIDCQRVFYEEMSDLYSENPERLKLIEIPRMDHYISTGMFEEAIEWFKKYL